MTEKKKKHTNRTASSHRVGGLRGEIGQVVFNKWGKKEGRYPTVTQGRKAIAFRVWLPEVVHSLGVPQPPIPGLPGVQDLEKAANEGACPLQPTQEC